MAKIRHLAMLTKNNRRLARFYHLIFGMEEVWNPFQNSPYSCYVGDGYVNLNINLIHSGSGRAKIVDGKEILPNVEINHIGLQVDSIEEIAKKISQVDPPQKLVPSRRDGRYEDERLVDADENALEIAKRGWDAGEARGLPLIRHVGIGTTEPDRLADFYKSVFGMKKVGHKDKEGTKAIYLSDGTINIALVKNSPIPKSGFQAVGFQVPSISEIEERLRTAPPYLYPGEAPVEIAQRSSESPYKSYYLRDPDGNYVDLSEEGWEV